MDGCERARRMPVDKTYCVFRPGKLLCCVLCTWDLLRPASDIVDLIITDYNSRRTFPIVIEFIREIIDSRTKTVNKERITEEILANSFVFI